MNVYIIAALSVDGFIAKTSNEFINWTSKEDKQKFATLTKESGVVVMGGNTYRTMTGPLKDRKNIVYSRSKIDDPNVETTQKDPKALIEQLKTEGFESVAICGGQSIYEMFLRSDVVTDVYLTVEPLFFGKGVSLALSPLDIKLNLLSSEKLNENTIFSHYKVVN